jgi:cis-3-alkyl-4-acyloxetan-2-one decarboxylase
MQSRAGFEREYPFPSQVFDLGGLRYHYIDEGNRADDAARETLLFVHGNPTWSFAWRNLIKGLSADYRCIAVDHIGCGFSDKPQDYSYRLAQHIENLQRLVCQLDLTRVTLVAHDWGGAIGLGVVARIRERFSRIVLCNTAAFRSQRIPWRIAVCRWPGLGVLGVRGLNLFARAALSMAVVRHDRMNPEVCRGYLAPYGSWNDRVAIHRFVQDIPLHAGHPSYATLVEVEESLARLAETPVLLVWGERDWCFTPEFRQEFERRLPHAETLAIADAGHYVFEDAHERIVPRIREFLAAHRRPVS